MTEHDNWYKIYSDLVLGGMDPDEAEVVATDMLDEQEEWEVLE